MTKSFADLLTWIPTTAMAGVVFLYSTFSGNLMKERVGNLSINNEEENPVFYQSPILTENGEILLENYRFISNGFVVVLGEDHGNPSEVLGIVETTAPENASTLIVKLNRQLEAGEWIYLNYFVDDGDGTFEIGEDAINLDTFGKQFLKFKVPNPPESSFENQSF